ncbi:hypothetical protein TNCV_33911 [Trichonephila clavipes]|nr:hypothetical protein TNCV_33911 [Trichonephila clavipes]
MMLCIVAVEKGITKRYNSWGVARAISMIRNSKVTEALTYKVLCYPLCCRSPLGGATAYRLLHRSINRHVANRVTKKGANLALSLTFRYVSIESSL